VRCYVVAGRAGVHLEIVRYVVVQPHWFKGLVASLVLQGAWWGWSLPKGLRPSEELAALLSVVDAGIAGMTKLYAARAHAGGGNNDDVAGSVGS
jgi:hypothetical protein